MIFKDLYTDQPLKTVFTVSALTMRIKTILEDNFNLVWVEGEISNLKIPSSGHYYFTVKDKKAQIAAVMFKTQTKKLESGLKDGMSVTGFGRISLYEPRGSYQIIFEYLEPKGAGSLQLAFEQLKEKLSAEGLFDSSKKKQIPFLPEKISIITSPSGAVIRDIINVAKRRFPSVHLEIVPANVQGESAVSQLVDAIRLVGKLENTDLIIIARGGGSLEDLAPFNSESLARAVFESKIPVISAVGHETDFTICDFVADLRAPTPSAAAEIALPDKTVLESLESKLRNRLINSFRRQTVFHKVHLASIVKRLANPSKKIQELSLKCDDITARLHRAASGYAEKRKIRLESITNRLFSGKFVSDIKSMEYRTVNLKNRLKTSGLNILQKRRARMAGLDAYLAALNPSAVLKRGYSITRLVPEGKILLDASDVKPGAVIETVLANGSLISRVGEKEES